MLHFVLFYLAAVLTGWSLLVRVPLNAVMAVTDNQHNFYVADDRGAVLKYDSLCNEVYRYNRPAGMPSNIDATNPFKPLIYYAGTQTIVITDNTLSQAGTLELQRLGYVRVTSVCRASDDNIWLYDAFNYRVIRISPNGDVLHEGTDLLQQTGFAPEVQFMVAHEQKVYLCDSTHGILVTDLYGNYEKTIPIKGLKRFQCLRDVLLYTIDNNLMTYNLRTAQTDSVVVDGVEPFHQAVYSVDRLLTLGQNQLSLYRKE